MFSPHQSRRRLLLAALCVGGAWLAGGRVQAWGQPVGSDTASSETVVWGQEVFAIPYQWSGQTDPSQARRVVLHLSRDGGATWRQVSAAEPRVQSFNYRATGDGDYWFAVRTIDSVGRSWPQGPLTPELHVAVDTRIPTISGLSATISPGGGVSVGCFIQDPHLDATAVRVMVQEAGGWRDLSIEPSPSANNATLVVRAAGRLAAGATQTAVRVSAVDRAGNPAEAGVVATLGGAATAVRPPALNSSAAKPFGFASQPFLPRNPAPSSAPRDPFLGQARVFGRVEPRPTPSAASGINAAPRVGADKANSQWQSIPSQAGSPMTSVGKPAQGTIAWAPDGFSRAPYRGEALPLTPVAPSVPTLSPQAAAPRGAPNPPSSVYRSEGPRSSFASLSPAPSVSLPTAPAAIPSTGPAPPLSGLASVAPAFRTSPLPEAAQFIGSQRFELDYDVAAAGRWGVERVTLWGSRDRGKTWRTFAVDSDNRSPLDVSVDDEGLYGFRITVEGVGGLTPEGPRPGDAPELWVEVDQTDPQVRLTAAHQGEGYFGDHLVIHWQAGDANLAPRPITLSYASRPDGPWAPMASSIENTGRYAWRLQRHLPARLYLRVEAQDAAGNTGVAVTPQPLAIDLPTPEATVRAVRPLGG